MIELYINIYVRYLRLNCRKICIAQDNCNNFWKNNSGFLNLFHDLLMKQIVRTRNIQFR